MQLNLEPTVLDPTLNEQINEAVWKFVGGMEGSGQSLELYKKERNASNAVENAFVGKKAEFFLSAHLIYVEDYPRVLPDVGVRQGASKGWGFDLPYPKGYFSFHAKATSIRHDLSWTFQWGNKSGGYGRDPIFSNIDDSRTAFIYLDDPLSNIGYIKVIMPTQDVIPLLREPRMQKYVGIKKCLYYGDLCDDGYDNTEFDTPDVDSWFE